MSTPRATASPDPGILETLRADLGRTRDQWQHEGFKAPATRTLTDLEAFYLDQPQRARLARMNRARHAVWSAAWLLRALFLRLATARRVLLVLSALMLAAASQVPPPDSAPPALVAALPLVVVLLLELKDKLVARHELEDGRAVQRALMPAPTPEVPGWDVWLSTNPANDVGGDLVDCVPVNGTRFGLVLGDVAGKGLGAALLMAKLQSTIRAWADTAPSPADLGRRVNRILCRDGLPSSFATLVYAEVSPGSGHVRVLNAGHMPPLRVTASGVAALPRGGIALGVTPAADYEAQAVDLESGDLLVVYSDGVTEAMNLEGEFFDEVRLLEVVSQAAGRSARETARAILDAVVSFVGVAPAHDDVSLVILKRKPAP
jgi:hypothetical protein